MSDTHLKNREWMVSALCGEIFGPGGACDGWKNDLYGEAEELSQQAVYSFESRWAWEDFKRVRHVEAGTRQEVLKDVPPSKHYGVGILFPETPEDKRSSGSDASNETADTAIAQEASMGVADEDEDAARNENKPKVFSKLRERAALLSSRRDTGAEADEDVGSADDAELSDESDAQALSLARIMRPRSMGISFLVDTAKGASKAIVTGGRYRPVDCEVQALAKPRRIWIRMPVKGEVEIEWSATELSRRLPIELLPSCAPHLEPLRLELDVRLRVPPKSFGEFPPSVRLATVTLVNCSVASRGGGDKLALFQSRFSVMSAAGDSSPFLPLPDISHQRDEEQQSLALLYRTTPVFCHGHGCGGDWVCNASTDNGQPVSASEVIAEPFPVYQTPPVTANLTYPSRHYQNSRDAQLTAHPKSGQKLRIFMAPLARAEEGWLEPLQEVADLYGSWIRERAEEIASLPEVHRAAARRHVDSATECHRRIVEGIDLLTREPMAAKAFAMANHAIILQQIAGGTKLRDVRFNERSERFEYPEGRKPSLELDEEESDEGKKCAWRPFQIAFLLMSLQGLWDGKHPDRDVADLIWFPTGGGKTEAYLAAAAFHILSRRLNDPADVGTAVLMRYTLRLLTAQQFQRAAGLICALEVLRRKHTEELGVQSFTIGIWVGGDTTPNTRKQSVEAYRDAKTYGESRYKHVLLRCPWCAARMGYFRYKKNERKWTNELLGLRLTGSGAHESVELFCPDGKHCEFAKGLPLLVADDEIYEAKPSLVIGTVDKFSMLAWRPEARALFGLSEEGEHEVTPPGLIIQDELHLITGPLGSMVGLYEGLIDSLCTEQVASGLVRPKLIASTATTRASTSQIRDLYDRSSTFLFPPPGLNADDSFFATYDRDEKGDIRPGRMYVGVLARSYGSGLTVNVRVLSTLMAAAALVAEEDRNPWHTLLIFYNSLRELGAGLTLYSLDIPERLFKLRWLWGTGLKKGRLLHEDRILELTGRLANSDIPKALQALERDFPPGSSLPAVDACLASNIIEVGVDVPRLGLMAVSGQPKNTAQYIQATGRVGRDKPGLVVMIYDNKKARDLSHYEHFRGYHGTLYAAVEPASVTPFTLPVLERALHGVFVAWVRNKLPLSAQADPRDFQDPKSPMRRSFREFREFYRNRILSLFAADKNARDAALEMFSRVVDRREKEWLERTAAGGDQCAVQWVNKEMTSDESADMPLIRRYGEACKALWSDSTWETPTSMRGVDAECEAGICNAARPLAPQ
jgi:hypothetical protein